MFAPVSACASACTAAARSRGEAERFRRESCFRDRCACRLAPCRWHRRPARRRTTRPRSCSSRDAGTPAVRPSEPCLGCLAGMERDPASAVALPEGPTPLNGDTTPDACRFWGARALRKGTRRRRRASVERQPQRARAAAYVSTRLTTVRLKNAGDAHVAARGAGGGRPVGLTKICGI